MGTFSGYQDAAGARGGAPWRAAAFRGHGSAKARSRLSSLSIIELGACALRVKVFAVVLDPAGFGVLATLQSLVELARSVSQAGLGAAGSRRVLWAAASRDEHAVQAIDHVLRRASMAFAALGAIAFFFGANWLSQLTFGDHAHANHFALLGLAVGLLAAGGVRGDLLLARRRTRAYAGVALAGGLAATAAAVFSSRWQGDAPLVILIVSAVVTAAAAWCSTHFGGPVPAMASGELPHETVALVKSGVVLCTSGVVALGFAYLTRVVVMRVGDAVAVGLFQAALTLGGAVAGVMLQTATKQLPLQLAAADGNTTRMNTLVNDRIRASLRIATPCTLATLALAPFLVPLCLSQSFTGCTGALRWMCLAAFLRTLGGPLNALLVASRRGMEPVLIEVLCGLVGLHLLWVGVELLGVEGAAIAYAAAQVIHLAVLAIVVHRGCHWKPFAGFARAFACSAGLLATVFLASAFGSATMRGAGALLALACCTLALWRSSSRRPASNSVRIPHAEEGTC
jgi:PST family polysaccharide transporter